MTPFDRGQAITMRSSLSGDVPAQGHRQEEDKHHGRGCHILVAPNELRSTVANGAGPRLDWEVLQMPADIFREIRHRGVSALRLLPQCGQDDRIQIALQAVAEFPGISAAHAADVVRSTRGHTSIRKSLFFGSRDRSARLERLLLTNGA